MSLSPQRERSACALQIHLLAAHVALASDIDPVASPYWRWVDLEGNKNYPWMREFSDTLRYEYDWDVCMKSECDDSDSYSI